MIDAGVTPAMLVAIGLILAACGPGGGDRTDISDRIAAAGGGDVVIVPPGRYGDLAIDRDFSSNVVIRSATPLAAQFASVVVTGSRIVFDGVAISDRITIRDADDIEIVNSKTGYWTEALFSSNVTIRDSDVTSTVNIEAVDGFSIIGNAIGRSAGGVDGDLIRVIGDSRNGVIENNSLEDVAPRKYPDGTVTHADGIQFINRGADWPSDIVIRGNLIFDDPATGDSGNLWMQAIAVGGSNILIEQNLVMTGSPNAIIVANSYGGDVQVLNNTVLPWPGGGGGNIRVTSTTNGVVVDGNVSNLILNEGGATIGDNFQYSTKSDAVIYYGSIYQLQADGMIWSDYTPEPGSPVDFGSGYGALERVAKLLGAQ